LKISKTTWIIIISAITFAAFAGLGALSWQLHQTRDLVRGDLALTEEKLAEYQSGRFAYRQEVLELQLNEKVAALKTSRSLFSQPSWYIATTALFDIASANNVAVTEIRSAGLDHEKLGEITYTVQWFNTTIKGEVIDLVNCITRLNHDLETSVVKSVTLNVPVNGEGKPSADLLMVVYTYEGG
jgi:hypothetical protein